MSQYEVELFKDVGLKDEVNLYAKTLYFKKGETLFYGNQLMRYFYIILSGTIKTYQLNLHNAKEQTIFVFSKGDMFDTIVLLDNEPHDVMYEALEESEVMQLPIDKVREWIEYNPEFNQKFFPYLAAQMRHMEELSTDLALHSTGERLIKLILQNLNPHQEHHFNLINNISHSEIANLIGTVRHVVERHLNTLKKEGAIEQTHRKHIKIKDIQKLLDKLQM
jgi:CRP-like cAMP-binding protein